MHPALSLLINKIKGFAVRILGFLQSLSLYRTAARRLIRKRVRCRIAGTADTRAVAKFYAPIVGDSVESLVGQIEDLQDDGHVLIACLGERLVGAVTVRRSLEEATRSSDWWLSGMQVDSRWRGTGIGEKLVGLAIEVVGSANAERLNLMVFEHNLPAVGFYRKMGFKQPAPSGDLRGIVPAAHDSQQPKIVMTMKL
jgi:GNAT superfamily N-acetyltransferase